MGPHQKSLEPILDGFLDDTFKLSALGLRDSRGNTVLQLIERNPELINRILASLSNDEFKLKAIRLINRNGNTLLHSVFGDLKSFKIILNSLSSEQAKLEVAGLPNHYRNTILHLTAPHIEQFKISLALYPNNKEKLDALGLKNIDGQTAFSLAGNSIPPMVVILALYDGNHADTTNAIRVAIKASKKSSQRVEKAGNIEPDDMASNNADADREPFLLFVKHLCDFNWSAYYKKGNHRDNPKHKPRTVCAIAKLIATADLNNSESLQQVLNTIQKETKKKTGSKFKEDSAGFFKGRKDSTQVFYRILSTIDTKPLSEIKQTLQSQVKEQYFLDEVAFNPDGNHLPPVPQGNA